MATPGIVESSFVLTVSDRLSTYNRLTSRGKSEDATLRINLDGTGTFRIINNFTTESVDIPVALFDSKHLCLFSSDYSHLCRLRSFLLNSGFESAMLTIPECYRISQEDISGFKVRMVLSSYSAGVSFSLANEYEGGQSVIRISPSGHIHFTQTGSVDQICDILNAAIHVMERATQKSIDESVTHSLVI